MDTAAPPPMGYWVRRRRQTAETAGTAEAWGTSIATEATALLRSVATAAMLDPEPVHD